MPTQYEFTHTDEIIEFVSEQKPTAKDKNHLLRFVYMRGNQKLGQFVEIKPDELKRLFHFNCLKEIGLNGNKNNL